ncbi:MAG: prolyl oligopeptidase family serine peptidase [Pseudomonadota bacterium]
MTLADLRVVCVTGAHLLAGLLMFISPGKAAGEPLLPLDIDALYGEPSLIGTRPVGVSWSWDSSRIAFAWHDAGGQFRDVWTWSPGQDTPTRLTNHEGEDVRLASGISSVAWVNLRTPAVAYVLGERVLLRTPGTQASMELLKAQSLRQLSASPTGKRLAVVTPGTLLSLDPASDNPRAQPLVAFDAETQAISSFEWSRDGRKIAFLLVDRGPLPERDIHFYTREGHQQSRVRRAFPGDNTERFKLGVVDVATASVNYLARPDDTEYVWNYALSEAGDRLLVNTSDLLVKRHQVSSYDLATGVRQALYVEHDPLHLRPDWRADWAPGQQGMVLLTDKDGYSHLYLQPEPEAVAQPMTSGPWEIARFWTNPTSGWVYFLANRSHLADRQLYRIKLTGGAIERMTAGHGTHAPVFSPDLQHAISLYSNDTTPHELLHIDLDQTTVQPITRSPLPAFPTYTWANVRFVEFPSRLDGATLIGRLSVPADFDSKRRYPLIVGSVYSDSVTNQWGGRQAHPTWGLDQALVARGFVVLSVNVRGSFGQGRAHNQKQRHGYGIVDIEDLHSGVEFLVGQGVADPERVGIWGSSYGGLMTLMSLFKKPGVYAVGIAGAPASNVAHAYPAQRWVMGPEIGEDQPERYQSQSPLYHSQGLVDPLMIIHGTKDPVVLYSDTIALAEDLIDAEKDFELVTLPGVGHGWDAEAPTVRRFAFKKMIGFLERHLDP